VRVGFIGLGDQGLPIAQRIHQAGLPLTVWARREASLEPFRGTDVTVAASPREVGDASDLVGICVFDGAGVDQVLFGPDGVVTGLRPGGIVLIHSTISPDEVQVIAAKSAERDVRVLDAPVTGGALKAQSGTLTIMIGGDAGTLAEARPVLTTYAEAVVHLGGIGAGQWTKLLNNVLLAANIASAADAVDIGMARGIDRDALVSVLAAGSGRSFAVEMLRPGGLDVLARGQARPTLTKDVQLLATATEGAPKGGLVQGGERFVRDIDAAANTPTT